MDLITDLHEPNWLLAAILVALAMIAWRLAMTCHRRIRAGAAPMFHLLAGTVVLYAVSVVLIVSAMMAL